MLEVLEAVLIWVITISTTWTSSTRNAMFNLHNETSVYFSREPIPDRLVHVFAQARESDRGPLTTDDARIPLVQELVSYLESPQSRPHGLRLAARV